jgi:hypothetical protein
MVARARVPGDQLLDVFPLPLPDGSGSRRHLPPVETISGTGVTRDLARRHVYETDTYLNGYIEGFMRYHISMRSTWPHAGSGYIRMLCICRVHSALLRVIRATGTIEQYQAFSG